MGSLLGYPGIKECMNDITRREGEVKKYADLVTMQATHGKLPIRLFLVSSDKDRRKEMAKQLRRTQESFSSNGGTCNHDRPADL